MKKIYFNNKRTHSRQKIDSIEEKEGHLCGYEFKWKPASKKIPRQLPEVYPENPLEMIHPDHFASIVGISKSVIVQKVTF